MYRDKWLLRSIVCGLVLGIATQTFAALPTCRGWYAEGNLGATGIWGGSYPGPTTQPSLPSGWNINAGYKFIRYFAAEIGFTSYYLGTNYDLRVFDNNNNQAALVRHNAFDLAGKLMVPLSNTGLQVFGKAGIAVINAQTSITDGNAANNIGLNPSKRDAVGPFLGVGAEYYFTADLAANVQFNAAVGNGNGVGRAGLLSAGLMAIFPT